MNISKLYKCPNCNTIFRLVKQNNNEYKTDLDGKITVDNGNAKCLCCSNEGNFESNTMNVEPWIVDLFYKVKGN